MSEEIKPIEIVKRGETTLTVNLVRSAGGLTVHVRAHPAVEQFIRGLGTGETVDVKASGPYWRPLTGEGKPLNVYALTESVPNLHLDGGEQVTIGRPGQQLFTHEGVSLDGSRARGAVVNLSFLRLVGISEGAGVSFTVRGVHTYDAVVRMKELIGKGFKDFYKTYMKPYKMEIVVSTHEVALPGTVQIDKEFVDGPRVGA